MAVQEIPINQIVHGATQCREAFREDVVEEYRSAAKEGVLPPVVVFFDGTSYFLADGHYRREAHVLEGLATIKAEVRHGGLREAVLYAAGANATHGLRRTREDKRKSILMLLADDEWGQASDRWVAEQCHVSDHTVASVRESTAQTRSRERQGGEKEEEEGSGGKRTGSDGRRRPSRRKDPELLCDRCRRAGKTKGCKDCAKIKRMPKQGASVATAAEFKGIMNQGMRAIETIAHSLGLEKQSRRGMAPSVIETPEICGFRRRLEELKKDVEKWMKEVKKQQKG